MSIDIQMDLDSFLSTFVLDQSFIRQCICLHDLYTFKKNNPEVFPEGMMMFENEFSMYENDLTEKIENTLKTNCPMVNYLQADSVFILNDTSLIQPHSFSTIPYFNLEQFVSLICK